MSKNDEIQTYEGYRWIVHHTDLLGGKPTIKGTRLSVSLVLNCLSEGMSVEEIASTYGEFPSDCVPEVLKFASQVLDKSDVAA